MLDNLIYTEIAKYKDSILSDFEPEDNSAQQFRDLIAEKEALLVKQKKHWL